MNLATLERMVREGDLSSTACRYLLDCRGECEWLDYKETLLLQHDAKLCDFAKDVLAIKNVGGGFLLVGVEDKTWRPKGLGGPFPYDTKLLRDQVRRATGLDLDIDAVTHTLDAGGGRKTFALVFIRASRKRAKRRSPTVVARDFCAGEAFGLRRGDIYVRRGDSTVRLSTQGELDDLLDALDEQVSLDALQKDAAPSPFAVENGTYRLLSRGFDRFVGREDLRKTVLDAVLGDPRIWIVNVHGPGGVGKSALVNWVAHKLYEDRRFEAILQLTAKETELTEFGIRRYSRSLHSLDDLLDQILLLFEEDTECEFEAKKVLATELLSAWRTLLILDNMETVSDGRIVDFVQRLPPDSSARVLLTSRTKTGGWELPIPVVEMTKEETEQFLRLKSEELRVSFPLDSDTVARVTNAGGGLPLATQWILGQFKKTGSLDLVLEKTQETDSPVLEFCFGHIWRTLAAESRTVLALLSIFDGPTTVQKISVASEMPPDMIERSLGDLLEVTLINRSYHPSDGTAIYNALPITLAFAGNRLASMGDLELNCRRRLQQFNEQMALQASEVERFKGEFQRYGIESPTEKRAAILCRRAESEMFAGNAEGAELLFSQARELAPQSAYVLARSASYELARNRIGQALERANEACGRATRKTGGLCFGVKARVLDVQRDKAGRVKALEEALRYDPTDPVLRHQYGVALSRIGLEKEAIDEFSKIIEEEEVRAPPRETLVMALTTRVINLRRLRRPEEASLDVQRVKGLIDQYPHLGAAARRILSLD